MLFDCIKPSCSKVVWAVLLRGSKMRGVTETAVWAGSGDIFARGGGNTQEFLYAMIRTQALLISLGNSAEFNFPSFLLTCSVLEEFFWLLASFSNTNWLPVTGSALRCSPLFGRHFGHVSRVLTGKAFRRRNCLEETCLSGVIMKVSLIRFENYFIVVRGESIKVLSLRFSTRSECVTYDAHQSINQSSFVLQAEQEANNPRSHFWFLFCLVWFLSFFFFFQTKKEIRYENVLHDGLDFHTSLAPTPRIAEDQIQNKTAGRKIATTSTKPSWLLPILRD